MLITTVGRNKLSDIRAAQAKTLLGTVELAVLKVAKQENLRGPVVVPVRVRRRIRVPVDL